MFKHLSLLLKEFRPCFSRQATFHWFAIVIVGLLVRWDTHGVTSIIRCLVLEPAHYQSILHFFRASWELRDVTTAWIKLVCRYCEPLRVADHRLMLGDGIKVAKEANHMPGVKKLHQQSDNSTKPPFVYGHHFGVISLVISAKDKLFGLPIVAEIHEGVETLRKLQDKESPKLDGDERTTIITLMLNMASEAVLATGTKTILILDAYFSAGATFRMAKACVDQTGEQLLHVVTRAKTNVVAYTDPVSSEEARRGRPRKYGKKLRLLDQFAERSSDFVTDTLVLYGKERCISYLCLDLLWKPLRGKLRFVLVKDGSARFILMCSNPSISPTDIILAYSYRFKIEVAFKSLKSVIGGFCYHFWTSAIKKSVKSNIDELAHITDETQKALVREAFTAIEKFVNLSCIALGLLQILAIQFEEVIFSQSSDWLRTVRSSIPSEEIVRNVIRHAYIHNIDVFRRSWINAVITTKKRKHPSARTSNAI